MPAMRKQKVNRTAPRVVHFHLTETDWERLEARARREPGAAYLTGTSPHQFARRVTVSFLDGDVPELDAATTAAVADLAAEGETRGEALLRLLKVGIGRARTLAAQREKAS